MCGIAGYWTPGVVIDSQHEVAAMAKAIAHRGPDHANHWLDAAQGLALGHQRLAILDLSTAGHQPMHSHDGRWVIVYNGEIYNHQELRRALAGGALPWRGHSDTETLLAAIQTWGVPETLDRLRGMFAFALWDREQRELWLARDPLGEKPLYYGWMGRTLLFGSELKALRAHAEFDGRIDREALSQFLKFAYVPTPKSIYADIHKLPPGTSVCIRRPRELPAPVPYWSLAEVAERGMLHPFVGSLDEAADELERILTATVQRQMIADVPLGCLLSGGIDSSSIAALMQTAASKPVRTFTVGFADPDFDEAPGARAVAEHLGTDHTEVMLAPERALDLIDRLPALYDEPFADSSQLPTHLVMQVARSEVTVALSGDGGDEMLGGYNRYTAGPSLWRKVKWLPRAGRQLLGAALGRSPRSLLNAVLGPISRPLGFPRPGDKIDKLAHMLSSATDLESVYHALVEIWPGQTLVDRAPNPGRQWPTLSEAVSDPVARMMALDALTYLPDDILVKVDRAAMAVSLETRAPLLDRDVVEFCWTLPTTMKIQDGLGKRPLRQILYRHVPEALVEKPKMGFAVPLDDWLRGPLRDWADDLLAPAQLRRSGLHADRIANAWSRHRRGTASYGHRLWNVLMYQAWVNSLIGGQQPTAGAV